MFRQQGTSNSKNTIFWMLLIILSVAIQIAISRNSNWILPQREEIPHNNKTDDIENKRNHSQDETYKKNRHISRQKMLSLFRDATKGFRKLQKRNQLENIKKEKYKEVADLAASILEYENRNNRGQRVLDIECVNCEKEQLDDIFTDRIGELIGSAEGMTLNTIDCDLSRCEAYFVYRDAIKAMEFLKEMDTNWWREIDEVRQFQNQTKENGIIFSYKLDR